MEEDNYYDESIYLEIDKNKEALKKIEYLRKCYSIKKNMDINKYSFLIYEYDKYIEFIAYLIKELSIRDNAISSSFILDILTKKGVFSDFLEFKFDIDVSNILVSYLGVNVIKGIGCCRHIAAFQSDVISKLNLMSDSFYCYITDKNISNAYDTKGNHVINLIEYDGALYGYDAVFSSLFRFIDSLKLESVYNDKKLYAYYKPYTEMIFNGVSIDNILSLIKLFDRIKDNDIISSYEYMDICRYSRDMINKNTDLIKDFQESSKKHVKRIVKELK